MNFPQALELAKAGAGIARLEWNGRGFVVYRQGYPKGVANAVQASIAIGQPKGNACRFSPYLVTSNDDDALVPWLLSLTDALTDDWFVV